MAALERLNPNHDGSMGDEVYAVLREAIIDGTLRPNERLVETQLAATLGVSRTPVREAIHRLEMDGLVRALPNRSTVAAWFSAEDVEHIYSLRARVEGYAARLMAENPSEEALAKLEAICRRFADVSSKEQDMLNREFHKTIVEACGAERVRMVAMSLVEHSLMSRLYLLHTSADRVRTRVEHSAILSALRQRNGDEADRLVREHLEWARDILLGRNR